MSHSSCQALLVSARPWVRALGSQAASDLHEGLAARTSCKQIHVGSHETVWSRNFYFRSGNLDVNNMSTAQFGFRFQPWCANPYTLGRSEWKKELARVAGNESLRSCWKNMFFASCRKFHAAACNVARNIIDMFFITFYVVPSSGYNPIDLSVCVNTTPCNALQETQQISIFFFRPRLSLEVFLNHIKIIKSCSNVLCRQGIAEFQCKRLPRWIPSIVPWHIRV